VGLFRAVVEADGLAEASAEVGRAGEADVAGAEPIVVLSHDYWQTRFGGSPAAMGQTLQVNNNHILEKKAPKRMRRLKGETSVAPGDAARINRMLGR